MTGPAEWGPWIDQDGSGCPCIGQLVHAQFFDGADMVAIAGSGGGESWDMDSGYNQVIRYRVAKNGDET